MKKIIRKILTEEVDTRRDAYLNKILGFLVEDTIIDLKKQKIRYPFSGSRYVSTFHSFPLQPFSHTHLDLFLISFLPLFSDYCKDNYSLTDEEIDYVWKEYKNIIINKINNMGSINESMGKISREDYLNKILNILVDDSVIDFKKKTMIYPPSALNSTSSFLPIPFLLTGFSYHRLSRLNILFTLFSEYCKYNYDLTENEVDYVWEEYKNIIINKIKKRGIKWG